MGKNGGALPTDEKIYWVKLDQNLYPNELAFKNNLKTIIETRMNSIINSASEYSTGKVNVKLNYFALNPVEIDDTQLTVSAISQSPLAASSDIAVVKSDFATSRTVETRIFRLYELGKEVASELKTYISGKKQKAK